MPAADESGAGTRARINSQSHCLPWHRLRSRSGRNGEANWGAKFRLTELEVDEQVKCKQRTAPLFATVHPRSIPRRLVPLQATALGRYSSGVTRLLGAQGRLLGTTEPGFVRCPFA